MEATNEQYLVEELRQNLPKMKDVMNKEIKEYFETKKVPGLAYVFFSPEGIIYSKTYGYRNLEKSLPFTLDSYASFGSCGKVIIAMSIMRLVEQGKLDVNNRIDQFVPIKNLNSENPITVHHLLTHSSGIPFGIQQAKLKTWVMLYDTINRAIEKTNRLPGVRWDYSNCGYGLLGRIVDIVSGKDFFEFTTQEILKPLHMNDSRFVPDLYEFFESGLDKDEMYSLPYYNKNMEDKEKEPLITKEKPFKHVRSMGIDHALLYTSCNEMMNVITMLMQNGMFKGNQILSKKSVNEILKRQKYIEHPHDSKDPNRKIYYGYGWRQYDFCNDELYYHTGGFYGTGAYIGFLKNYKIGFVFLNNLGGYLPHSQIVNALRTLACK